MESAEMERCIVSSSGKSGRINSPGPEFIQLESGYRKKAEEQLSTRARIYDSAASDRKVFVPGFKELREVLRHTES